MILAERLEMTIFDITAFVLSCHYGVLNESGEVKKVDESYRSLTPQEFERTAYGVCHDFANWVTYQLSLEGFTPVNCQPKEGECAILYIRFSFKGSCVHENIHAMPIFMLDGKLHIIEGTWNYPEALGHHEYSSLRELGLAQLDLIELTLDQYNLERTSDVEYWFTNPKWEGGYTREQLIAH